MEVTYIMDYKKNLSAIQHEKLKVILSDLPSFCCDYFDYCDGTLNRSTATMLEYAYDIRSYFKFIAAGNPLINSYHDVTLDILDKMTPRDIQEYMSYLRSHKDESGRIVTNDANARARKLSSLRSFYQYYFAFAGLHSNPAKLISSPKLHQKKQPRLDSEEIKELLTDVITVGALDDNKRPYAIRSNLRDTAIIALLGGTGIRVSELVGIDLNDIDWEHNSIKIVRKGGNEDIVYFGEEISKYMADYIDNERKPGDKKENALFVASRGEKSVLQCVPLNVLFLNTVQLQFLPKRFLLTVYAVPLEQIIMKPHLIYMQLPMHSVIKISRLQKIIMPIFPTVKSNR